MTYARMLREEKGRETFGLYDYAAEGYKKDALFFSRQMVVERLEFCLCLSLKLMHYFSGISISTVINVRIEI